MGPERLLTGREIGDHWKKILLGAIIMNKDLTRNPDELIDAVEEYVSANIRPYAEALDRASVQGESGGAGE